MNWRRHPEKQKKILDAVLTEVGWAGVALYNETTGRLIDGHARRDWAIEKKHKVMPVLMGSWSEADEKKILATMDPIAAMAAQADQLYFELLEGMQTEDQNLQQWHEDILSDLSEMLDDASLKQSSSYEHLSEKLRKSKRAARIIVAMDDLECFERAIAKTGDINRGNALALICRKYLGETNVQESRSE